MQSPILTSNFELIFRPPWAITKRSARNWILQSTYATQKLNESISSLWAQLEQKQRCQVAARARQQARSRSAGLPRPAFKYYSLPPCFSVRKLVQDRAGSKKSDVQICVNSSLKQETERLAIGAGVLSSILPDQWTTIALVAPRFKSGE